MIAKLFQKWLERSGLPAGDLAGPSFGVALMNGTGMLLQFLAAFLLARMLGADGYGIFAYALSWAQLLSAIGLLGSDKLLLREISKEHSKGNARAIRPLLGWTKLRILGILVTLSVLGLSASFLPFPPFNDPETLFAFQLSMVAVPFLGLITLQRAALQGTGSVLSGQFVEKTVRPFGLILGVLILYGAWRKIDVGNAVLINLIALFIAVAIGTVLLLQKTEKGGMESVTKERRKLLERAGLAFLLIGWMQILAGRWDLLVLGSLGENSKTGVLQIVIRASFILHFFLNALNTALAPRLAEWHQRGEKKRMQSSLTRGVRGICILSLPIAALLFLFPTKVLSIFGSEFTMGSSALLIYTAARAFGLILGPNGYALMMTGHQVRMMRVILVANSLHLILALILIPPFGLWGAAISFFSSSLIERTWMYFEVRAALGIDPSIFGMKIS